MSNSGTPPDHVSHHGTDHAQGPPRKRMRKGTKSCIECRRRKIKCTFEPGRTSICNECFARGSTCIDQEHGDVSSFIAPPSNPISKDEQNSALKERVTYLEDLVKQVLDRLPEKNGSNESPTAQPRFESPSLQADAQAAEVLKSLRSPVRPQIVEDSILMPGGELNSESAPALSLFDNAVITRKEVPVTISRAQYNKSKSLIAALLQLLPTPDDLEIILENSQEWWAIWRTMFPHITDRRCITIKESVSHSLRSEKPAEIAKIMLCIALSINQLPQDFDWSKVSLKESRSDLMERYISVVDKLIISDDEIAATVDGLECMVLAAKYHINLGRPRRSWLLYHRAIAFGQLLGLHRLSLRRPKEPDAEYYRQLMVWTHLVMGDRYLSLILGLPYSVAETFVQSTIREAAVIAQDSAKGEAYLARMAPLMTKLIDRNQSPTTIPYQVTLQLDNELEEIKSHTPRQWWSTDRLPGSTIEEHFDRLQAQFFHYHTKVLLHMPFMLRSSTDKQLYQHSHTATLDAAREMIRYFNALRGAENVGPHICKLLDFQAFTAAMLLLLNICGYNSHARGGVPQQPDLEQDQDDSALIDRTIMLLRIAANEPGGVVASQCAKALDMLGKVRSGLCGEDEQNDCKGESCQIAIPYFGTISIGMGKNFVPIKPGTYPEAGTVKRSVSASKTSQQNYQNVPGGLPTPNSCSHSSQPSPSIRSDGMQQSPYEMPASAPSGMDNSWTASTEDPFITFDSFMAFPGAQIIDFGTDMANDSSMGSMYGQPQHMPDIDQQQAINLYGPQFQEQNLPSEGFPFPAVSGGLELDNGWNWMGVEAPAMH